MAQVMKGNGGLAEKSEAMEDLQVEAIEMKGSLSPTQGPPDIKGKAGKTNGRQLATPKPNNAARTRDHQKVSPMLKLRLTKKTKRVAPKGSPSVLEFPELKFPGIGKLPKLVYGNSIVYFSPGRYRVMRNKTDIVDKAFCYRKETPKKAWTKVCAELRRVNPRG